MALRRVDDTPASPVMRPAEYAGHNAFASDPVLTACMDATLDDRTEEELRTLGTYWGSVDAQEVARLATTNGPKLRREDIEGRRIDQVEMHPAYHALMNRSVTSGLLSSAWEDGDGTRQHRLRASTLYLTASCERGHLAPVCASHAAIASLAYAPELEAELFPLLASRRYDRRPIPVSEKEGAILTLAISERDHAGEHGAIRSRGELTAGDGIRITGEKAAVCAPGADLLLVLVKTADGPTAAIVPRYAPENADTIAIEQMLSPGGLEAQALANLRFEGARGRTIGDPGRGLQVLRDVRTLTQLDSAVIAAGSVRTAVGRAAHYLRTRFFDGQALIADPLNERLLADLALTSAAQTALSLRLAAAFDRAFERDGDHAVARVLTPATKIYVLKTAGAVAMEARELMGTAALSQTHPAARVAPDLGVFATWDGASNDAAHDLISLIARDESVLADALDELGTELGTQNADLIDRTMILGREAVANPGLARAFADQLAMVGAAAAMRANLPRVVSDAFVAARLRGGYTAQYGALDSRFDAAAIIDFTVPED
ncbi:acyl-CoA dehydrogenase family protein [Acuticoccus sp. MNP-M23]|uniref:acyl-CoA dehydrogenase family protein n=1 Tax=Acuticoccus sp. MNP-M23 TaxID=3072793 RepID=UPI002815E2DE|nr:acyl-CoA dehydrogenase family protein [Acuticoccus sp. MNP-M23]WMS43409.1 acyl-CoA dehydrogenase family protein [Acuticoccus sp. MNP-M23]